MIQELFGGGGEVLIGGGGGGGGEERKISIVGGGAVSSSSSSPSDNQNLRCPRCDSSNTKFCYYNNYNLTQPRHFCKTCRRYWTKGGALRNVPIGGGCRKSKSVSILNAGKSNNGKSKPPPSDVCKPSVGNGYSHDLIPNPILWATQQNSQLLALLRASQNQNPNPNPSSLMIGSHETPESAAMMSRSLDPLTQVSIGLSSSLWRTSQNHHQQQPQQQLLPQHTHQQQTMLFNEVPNPTGTIELYQRLRSSSNYYTDHPSAAIISNAATTPCTTSIVEPNSAAGGELGYWASSFSWPDLPTTNSAFP